jgi:hypothetical protein
MTALPLTDTTSAVMDDGAFGNCASVTHEKLKSIRSPTTGAAAISPNAPRPTALARISGRSGSSSRRNCSSHAYCVRRRSCSTRPSAWNADADARAARSASGAVTCGAGAAEPATARPMSLKPRVCGNGVTITSYASPTACAGSWTQPTSAPVITTSSPGLSCSVIGPATPPYVQAANCRVAVLVDALTFTTPFVSPSVRTVWAVPSAAVVAVVGAMPVPVPGASVTWNAT